MSAAEAYAASAAATNLESIRQVRHITHLGTYKSCQSVSQTASCVSCAVIRLVVFQLSCIIVSLVRIFFIIYFSLKSFCSLLSYAAETKLVLCSSFSTVFLNFIFIVLALLLLFSTASLSSVIVHLAHSILHIFYMDIFLFGYDAAQSEAFVTYHHQFGWIRFILIIKTSHKMSI